MGASVMSREELLITTAPFSLCATATGNVLPWINIKLAGRELSTWVIDKAPEASGDDLPCQACFERGKLRIYLI
jgi:hypothetical protein